MMTNFPISVDGSIESTPAIEDIDNDGDLEIVVGSTAGLEVIDIKSSAELMDSWSLYRGTLHRTGVYDVSVMSAGNKESIIPKSFMLVRITQIRLIHQLVFTLICQNQGIFQLRYLMSVVRWLKSLLIHMLTVVESKLVGQVRMNLI